ncbi:hypothetical protein [Natranaerobius trueperi]|uniref:Uncharacterized protein n=1 Tax=Natranaerobius trueperi TaxID=759412 RepID=A0A226BYZ0_9FIRM|nr:hypothetical protein [Natranaerobius trueperi]OWZ83350.1 hypothetical protein CDO51_09020 [Natranaerobius trueperi]
MRKFVLLFVVMLVLALGTSNVLAESVTDEKKAVLVEDGSTRVVTHEELDELYPKEVELDENSVTKVDKKDSISPKSITFYEYVEESATEDIDYSKSEHVTPWIDGSKDGATVSYGQSKTFSSSFDIGLSSSQINVILGELGVSYKETTSNDESFGTTFNISSGDVARVRFAPMVRESEGKIQTWRQLEGQANPRLRSEEAASASVLKEVGNFADGIYYLEYK